MTLNEYQEKAHETALGLARTTSWYPALGLAGEAGEVVEVVKKYYRDCTDWITFRYRLTQELGDVLWYMATLASWVEISLEDIAEANLTKLASRKERGTLQGSGDER